MIVLRRSDELFSSHAWFAWHPVALDSGGVAWLETVSRKIEPVPDGSYIIYYDKLPEGREASLMRLAAIAAIALALGVTAYTITRYLLR
jgi:hypothetical protein